jgi:hypothetical protein
LSYLVRGLVIGVLGEFFNFQRLKRGVAVAAVFAGLALASSPVRAGLFDVPPYSNPVFNCTTGVGCCADPGSVARDILTASGLYSGQHDMQQDYYVNTLWPKIETDLKKMADDMRNAALFYVAAAGAMMDGQNDTKSVLSLDKQVAQSMSGQTVSEQICRFGTMSRSLAQSSETARAAQLGLADQMQARLLMRANTNAGNAGKAKSEIGRTSDKIGRFAQFQKSFCDPTDSNAAVKGFCNTTSEVQHNKDIDVERSLDAPLTLDINFASGATASTKDEANIIALSSNLYAHDLPVNIGEAEFNAISQDSSEGADGRIRKLFQFRSLDAKRSVAQNSFAALAAMKAAGSAGSVDYMKEVIKELGLSTADDLTAAIGDKPSYYAQMDVLTRKLYQSPEFYANLMESPENVARQQASMEGIGLMQDRDIYESMHRSEMLLSSLLEIYVSKEQDGYKDKAVKK